MSCCFVPVHRISCPENDLFWKWFDIIVDNLHDLFSYASSVHFLTLMFFRKDCKGSRLPLNDLPQYGAGHSCILLVSHTLCKHTTVSFHWQSHFFFLKTLSFLQHGFDFLIKLLKIFRNRAGQCNTSVSFAELICGHLIILIGCVKVWVWGFWLSLEGWLCCSSW